MASQDDAKDTPNKDAVEMSKMRQQLAGKLLTIVYLSMLNKIQINT